MNNDQTTYSREQINKWRKQYLGKTIWSIGGTFEPDLEIGVATCSGIKIETGEFRIEGLSDGLRIGTLIRPRHQVFVSEQEISDYVTTWNKRIQTEIGCHGFAIFRKCGVIRIRPIRIVEDEWTGEDMIQFLTADEELPLDTEDFLVSVGYVIVKDKRFNALVEAVLNAARMYESKETT